MTSISKTYIAPANGEFSLNKLDTVYHGDLDKSTGEKELEKVKKKLSVCQETLYASGKHAVLIIFQAMDAAGKDSTIAHVMSGINPQGCEVHTFKTPSQEEYKHDFLWRHYKALPEKGKIGVHNRSHYENVLVCKVHPEYLLNENLPGYEDVKKINGEFWKRRYENIRNFERQLTDNGIVVIKFFLNVSKEEQKERFLARITDPTKNWKFAAGDLKERALWKEYMKAYETAIQETSTKNAPWYVIPADKKWYARLAVGKIIAETLADLDLKFPVLPKEEVQQLIAIKQQLIDE